jgi:hypothetical protein
MSMQAYSWPEATITIIPSDADNRAPFELGYAQGMSGTRSFVRAFDGTVSRVKDTLTIEAVWVSDEVYEWLKNPAVCDWVVEWRNEDGRYLEERWENVLITAVDRGGTLEEGPVRLSIQATGEPILN